MKKFLVILLAMMLVMVSVAAVADGEVEVEVQPLPIINNVTATSINGNTGTIVLKKSYDLTGATSATKHPADTLTFKVEWNEAVDTGVDFDETQWDEESDNFPTIAAVDVAEDASEYNFTIQLPEYTTYGVFQYIVTENPSKVAGMTNSKDVLFIRVGVAKKADATSENDVEIQFVAIRKADGTTAQKIDTEDAAYTNVYEAGKMTMEKKVEGNLGDKSKVWHFEVKFEAAENEVVKSTIAYKGSGVLSTDAAITENEDGTLSGKDNGDIPFGEGWREKTVYVGLADGENMVFSNIPEGVTYTVTETDAGYDGHTAAYDGNKTKTISKNDDLKTTIKNTKNMTPDTGITLETLPYVLMMALAMMGLVALKLRKREEY